MVPFSYSRRVQFAEADPAGIAYFAHVYGWHHEAYEAWVTQQLGIEYQEWFLSKDLGVPIRKSEAEYFGPFTPGQLLKVNLRLTQLGSSSFCLESTQSDELGNLRAKVQTVHVFMNTKTGKKTEVPALFRQKMQEQVEPRG